MAAAGAAAERGTIGNAAIALTVMMRTERFDEPHLLERNYRRRLYSERLTSLLEMRDGPSEDWE